MAKPRINLEAVIDTVAHAQTIRDYVQDQLAGKDIFEQRALKYSVNGDGQVEFNFDVRFNSEVDRNAVKDWILQQINDHPTVKNWFLRAELSIHRCTHDEAKIQSCDMTDFFLWAKGVD